MQKNLKTSGKRLAQSCSRKIETAEKVVKVGVSLVLLRVACSDLVCVAVGLDMAHLQLNNSLWMG